MRSRRRSPRGAGAQATEREGALPAEVFSTPEVRSVRRAAPPPVQSSFQPARRPQGEERSTENRLRPCVYVNTALPPLLIRAHASDLW